jgi:CubicO group peptidase (beta-lactamase class C family)
LSPVDGTWQAKLERQPDAQSPAGGVSSNFVDLARWIRMLLGNGTIDGVEQIKANELAKMIVSQIVSGTSPFTGQSGFYGLGWGLFTTSRAG